MGRGSAGEPTHEVKFHWAVVPAYPKWPCFTVRPLPSGDKDEVNVYFFGEDTAAPLARKNLLPYEPNFRKLVLASRKAAFVAAAVHSMNVYLMFNKMDKRSFAELTDMDVKELEALEARCKDPDYDLHLDVVSIALPEAAAQRLCPHLAKNTPKKGKLAAARRRRDIVEPILAADMKKPQKSPAPRHASPPGSSSSRTPPSKRRRTTGSASKSAKRPKAASARKRAGSAGMASSATKSAPRKRPAHARGSNMLSFTAEAPTSGERLPAAEYVESRVADALASAAAPVDGAALAEAAQKRVLGIALDPIFGQMRRTGARVVAVASDRASALPAALRAIPASAPAARRKAVLLLRDVADGSSTSLKLALETPETGAVITAWIADAVAALVAAPPGDRPRHIRLAKACFQCLLERPYRNLLADDRGMREALCLSAGEPALAETVRRVCNVLRLRARVRNGTAKITDVLQGPGVLTGPPFEGVIDALFPGHGGGMVEEEGAGPEAEGAKEVKHAGGAGGEGAATQVGAAGPRGEAENVKDAPLAVAAAGAGSAAGGEGAPPAPAGSPVPAPSSAAPAARGAATATATATATAKAPAGATSAVPAPAVAASDAPAAAPAVPAVPVVPAAGGGDRAANGAQLTALPRH